MGAATRFEMRKRAVCTSPLLLLETHVKLEIESGETSAVSQGAYSYHGQLHYNLLEIFKNTQILL